MEAGVGRKHLLLVLGLVLAIRLPFLNQAIQGDDHIYLSEAAHALIDSLHPMHATYVFAGEPVDLRGHPHPPLNAWILAGLLAAFGEVKEVPFHAVYVVFSMTAALAMWSLARRFSPRPLWATLLFLAVPAFVVNGNSLETDVPFVAFWMASIAFFCAGRLMLAVAAMTLATMTAYQAVLLSPILAAYLWLHRRRDRTAWLVLLTPLVVFAAWQIFERTTTGAMPTAVLGGYFTKYGLQQIGKKLANALMLFIHGWFIVFPPLVLWSLWHRPPGLCLAQQAEKHRPGGLCHKSTRFLLAWIAIFFVGAIAIFFAGSARYLLPIAAPVAILVSGVSTRWLAAGFAAQMVLSLGLATVNYQHWDGYRRFTQGHPRMWVNGEWGLRHYLEKDGALPLTRTQQLRPGDFIVTSELGRAVDVAAPTVPVARTEIRPPIPLRLIGLESRSGYSTVAAGFWPFGISTGIVDRVTMSKVIERTISLEYVPMNTPEATNQIVSGLYSLEDGRFRWMSRSAVIALKPPATPKVLTADFHIPEVARARKVSLFLDGREVASQTYPGPGGYILTTAAAITGSVARIEVDQTFFAPGDNRELGMVLNGVGFLR